MAAARLVQAGRADQHAVAAGDEPLRVVGRVAADDADGERLGDVLGDRQQLRHRLERPAEVILIEPGDDHALAAIGERVARGRQVRVEELPFVDADDLGVVVAPARRSSSELRTFCDAIRMSLCDTMWSSLKRLSMSGLKIWTFCRAICARRSRRISSSLLPLNMLPVMTSIQPCWGACGRHPW